MTSNGSVDRLNGFRKFVVPVAGSILGSLSVAAIVGLISVRDRLGQLESSWSVGNGAAAVVTAQRDVALLRTDVDELKRWRGQGDRFTRQDGDRLEQRLTDRITKIEDELKRIEIAEAGKR